MIAWLKTFWANHATKVWGVIGLGWGTLTYILAELAAEPDVRLIIPPRVFGYIALANLIIGAFTLKRGFVNSRHLRDCDGPPAA